MEIVMLVLMLVGAWFVGAMIRAAFTGGSGTAGGGQSAQSHSLLANDPSQFEDPALLGIDTDALWDEVSEAGYEHYRARRNAGEAPWGLIRKGYEEDAAYYEQLWERKYALVKAAEAAQHFTGWGSMTMEQRAVARESYQRRVTEAEARVRARAAVS